MPGARLIALVSVGAGLAGLAAWLLHPLVGLFVTSSITAGGLALVHGETRQRAAASAVLASLVVWGLELYLAEVIGAGHDFARRFAESPGLVGLAVAVVAALALADHRPQRR